MLHELDKIEWEALEDARGEAPTEFPGALRALASADKPSQRRRAFAELYEGLTHDGDFLHPLAFVVFPFLLELLDAESTPDRGLVLDLLVECACGGSHRPFIARGGYDGSADDFSDGAGGPTVRALRAQLAERRPVFKALLASKSKLVRASVAHGLGFLPEARPADMLVASSAAERDPLVAAQLTMALARLGRTDAPTPVVAPLTRWAGLLARLHAKDARFSQRDVNDVLSAATAAGDTFAPSLAPMTITARFLANAAYARNDLPLLLSLVQTDAIDPASVVAFALRAAFGARESGAPPLRPAQLTAGQRAVLADIGRIVREHSSALPTLSELGEAGFVGTTHFWRLVGPPGPADALAVTGEPFWFEAWRVMYGGGTPESFADLVPANAEGAAILSDVADYQLAFGWPPDHAASSYQRRPLSERLGRLLREALRRLPAELVHAQTGLALARAGRHRDLAPLLATSFSRGGRAAFESRMNDLEVMGDDLSVRELLTLAPLEMRESAVLTLGFRESLDESGELVHFAGAWKYLDLVRTAKVAAALLEHIEGMSWEVQRIVDGPPSALRDRVRAHVHEALKAFGTKETLLAAAVWSEVRGPAC